MTRFTYAHIDEQGRVILPVDLAKEWGLSPGDRMRVEPDGEGLHLRQPLTTLRRAYIELTNRCNLNCSTCMRNVWEVEYGGMAEPVFERILTGLQRFSPQPEIFFGGYGEPLSHPAGLALIARAKSLGFRVALITNGILLTQEVSRRLIEMGLDMLWVSLDGASPECYTDVRLGNALPQILHNLKQFQGLQYQRYGLSPVLLHPRLGIAFVAMQRNIHDLPEVIRLGSQLGASEFSVSNVLAHNEALWAENLYLQALDQVGNTFEQRWKPVIHAPRMDINPRTERVIGQLLKGSQRLNLFGGRAGGNGDRCPFVDRGSLSIRWDGKVSPCLPLLYTHQQYLGERKRTSQEYFVGDIHNQELSAIWLDPNYLALRDRLETFDFSPCICCNSCDMVDQNLEDCFGNTHPCCGGCLWAQGLIRCP